MGFKNIYIYIQVNLCLIRFGYRVTLFLNHALSLWFCGVKKQRWLVYLTFIIPSNQVKGKFETAENKLELLSV